MNHKILISLLPVALLIGCGGSGSTNSVEIENADSVEIENTDSSETDNTDSNETDNTGSSETDNTDSGETDNTDSSETDITDSGDTDSPDSVETESSSMQFIWDDWESSLNSDIQFYASETYQGASGFITLDGGDFSPTQSSTARVISEGGSATSYSQDGNSNTSFIGQSNNESYFIDIEVTVDETYTELTQFSVDTYVNNQADAQLNWTLSVEPTNLTAENVLQEGVFPYSEITLGTVERQSMSAETEQWQTLTFDLTSLSDNDAGVNGTVRFRLYAWGGSSDSVESNLTGIDNIVITAIEPETIEAVRPGLGERAAWMRGAWGINWKPTQYYNGYVELVTIDDFIDQIQDLSTLDYIQLHLNGSNIYSPLHTAPNDILESLWGDEAVEDLEIGNTSNLIVPRASSGIDPFKDWLEAVKGAGLKTQIYVNSSNLRYRIDSTNPDTFPDITERWYAFCDESLAVQAFLDSKPYYRDDDYPDREYMFCYAEFILRDYAKTYGHLIDAWLFDSADYMNDSGDDESSGILAEQRIYQAFAEAIRAGDRNVAASFNNGTGSVKENWSPLQRVTLFDDYSFGHPFGGGNYIGGGSGADTDGYGPGDEDVYDSSFMYDKNFRIVEVINETDGYPFNLSGDEDFDGYDFYDHFDWDDNVVGHFDPPMATLSWNSGATAALTDEHFTLWNTVAMIGNGAISWGGPLNGKKASNDNRDFTLNAWSLEQLTVMDAALAKIENTQ